MGELNVTLIPQQPQRTVTILMGWHRESVNPLPPAFHSRSRGPLVDTG
jgi:hypothetical protein